MAAVEIYLMLACKHAAATCMNNRAACRHEDSEGHVCTAYIWTGTSGWRHVGQVRHHCHSGQIDLGVAVCIPNLIPAVQYKQLVAQQVLENGWAHVTQ